MSVIYNFFFFMYYKTGNSFVFRFFKYGNDVTYQDDVTVCTDLNQ